MGHRRNRQCKSHGGFSVVTRGGRYILVSVARDDITFSDPEFHKRETTLLPAAMHSPTTRCEADGNGPALFREWSLPDGGVIKVIFEIGWVSELSLDATITRAKPPASVFK
jgi:hypothetical protein